MLLIQLKLFLVFVCSFVSGIFTSNGNSRLCQKLPHISKFNPSKMEDIWYGQEVTGRHSDKIGDCVLVEYRNDTVKMQNENEKALVLRTKQVKNTSEFTAPYKTPIGTIDVNVLIVATDFNNYAIAYACLARRGTAVILTKEQNPDTEIMKRARKVLKKHGFSVTKSTMTTIKQKDCKYKKE